MRRIISATVALALSGAIWACSSDNNGSPADGGGATGGTAGTGGTPSTGGTSTGGKASTGGTTATGGTTGTGGTTATGGTTGGPDAGDGGPPPPPPPVLGAQIDRLGRPGVNTALTDPFDLEGPTTTENAAKDAYNAASDPTKWAASFQSEIEQNLAIINGLDANCENQFAESPTKTDGGTSRYDALGGVLVDDELYVNTAATACGQYLAVEANATGIVPNADCGGRTLSYDVIDTTYSVLAIGKLAGVSDGVSEDDHADKQTATFPFLAPPQ